MSKTKSPSKSPGRPRLPASRARGAVIAAWMTPSDRARCARAAVLIGIPLGRWLANVGRAAAHDALAAVGEE